MLDSAGYICTGSSGETNQSGSVRVWRAWEKLAPITLPSRRGFLQRLPSFSIPKIITSRMGPKAFLCVVLLLLAASFLAIKPLRCAIVDFFKASSLHGCGDVATKACTHYV